MLADRDPVTNVTTWDGVGVWVLGAIMEMMKIPEEEVQIVTNIRK